jgi:TolA-binding protein
MRPFSVSFAVAALSLLPVMASAAPALAPSVPAGDTALQPAQYGPPPGWWEQSGRGDELRERYWRLPPRERYRYDQLEQQIRSLQAQQEQLRRDQRRILRWGD